MHIRRMTHKDLDNITEFERQIFPDPWSRRSFEFEVAGNPFSYPLVLEDQNKIIGYAVIWRIYEEFHIANLAILPDHQGKKFGKYFLEQILKNTDECKYAILEVRESNQRAIKLYENFGFRVIMKRTSYYKNGETALVMQKIFSQENHPESKR
jgi:ribosomal-protein-alanine N-acetyltransferase